MELLIYVMNKVELLDQLLEDFSKESEFRATIIDSMGMAHMLKDTGYFFSLRDLLNQSQENSKTILMVVKKESVEKAVRIIENNVGDLTEPDTGVVFTLPISYSKGIVKNN